MNQTKKEVHYCLRHVDSTAIYTNDNHLYVLCMQNTELTTWKSYSSIDIVLGFNEFFGCFYMSICLLDFISHLFIFNYISSRQFWIFCIFIYAIKQAVWNSLNVNEKEKDYFMWSGCDLELSKYIYIKFKFKTK